MKVFRAILLGFGKDVIYSQDPGYLILGLRILSPEKLGVSGFEDHESLQ